VTPPDEQTARGSARAAKSPPARYLFAITASAVAVVLAVVIVEAGLADRPLYAPLVAAVALTTWYGGTGPAALAIALSWGAALLTLVEPRGDLDFAATDDTARWWINLAVAVVVAGIGALLRLRQRQSAVEALSARATIRDIEALQQLTVALASALSPADVSRAVSFHALGILSADGVAVGLVEGDEVVVADAVGLATQPVPPGRGRDGSDIVAAAVRRGTLQVARDRRTLESRYGDSADALPAAVASAVAAPLQAAGDVAGAVLFVFAEEGSLHDDNIGLAGIVGDLAGQALERARLYEREQESRRALERILLVAPRFLADESGDLATTICREARTTFGSDYGVLWRTGEDTIDLVAIDPPRPDLSGARLSMEDFPRLREAIEGLRTSFVPDVRESTYGAGREFVHRLGIRSSLRTPMFVSGSSELVLSLSWETAVSEPDPATIAVVRRFVDQAGLALEHVERRRAQEEALARAEASRRLHEVTSDLSKAASSVEVGITCLEHALAAVGAEAGFVVLATGDGEVELVANRGYDDAELAAWRALPVDADSPVGRVLVSGEPLWALSSEEMAAVTAVAEPRSTGWVALPLKTQRGTGGVLHLSFRSTRKLSDAEREWLRSMVSQCGQALERSGLFEEEQRSRLRAERLQRITTLLSNAVTPSDVAQVVADEVAAAADAPGVALVAVRDGALATPLASRGTGDDPLAQLDADGSAVGGAAVRVLQSRQSDLFEDTGSTVLLVPLLSGRRVNGLLVATWSGSVQLASEDRAIVEALAGQAALALDRAEQFESEQAIAETLQRSVLPVSLPTLEGVEMAARYLPGSARLDVGGDWFDALTLPDGKVGLVVGDVVGKGVQAAASMAQLRNAIRAFSVERLKPSSMLARLDRLANDVLETSFATLAYLVLDPDTGVARLSSAGHPPPLLAHPDGRIEYLEEVRGLPLGTGVGARYRQHAVELEAGSLVLLYTDGLVERRGRSIDDGLAALREAVLDGPKDPDRLLDHVLDRMVGADERGDDIALLAARVLPVAPRPLTLRFRAHIASMDVVRDAMRAWLVGVPLDRRTSEDVVLATWEACANAIEHAVRPTSDVVALDAVVDGLIVRVAVRDTGAWAPASGREDRGLGLGLIEALVSTVEVEKGETGTTVILQQAVAESPSSG
jgi:serine/threonine-protein kinase RsbW